MTGRAAALTVAALLLLPGVAHGAGLVPLAPRAAWGSVPIHVAAPADDPRVFVAERGGAVRIVRGGVLQAQPFLVVPGVDASGERGLLSIAFPADFAASRRFYVFAVVSGEIRILEYRAGADPDLADPASQRIVYALPVVAGNHIGGQLAFGPDGRLYATIGDNAVRERAQDPASPFGKVLRLDPTATNAGVPAPEVWALGLRNPYRAAFTPDGSLVIGDVGEGTWEEVNVADGAGRNFGWPRCEGPCSPADPAFTDPVHVDGNPPSRCAAVIGGVVVRDPDLDGLTGRYLFGDLCAAPLRSLDLAAAGADPRAEALTTMPGNDLLGFGEDAFGCVYVLADGVAYRVAADVAGGAACPRGPRVVTPPAPVPGVPIVALPPGPAAPAPPAGAAAAGAAGTPQRPGRLRVVSGGLRADARGRVAVAVRCEGATDCTGRLRLRTAARVRLLGRRDARVLELATRDVPRILAGRTARLTVTLGARERRLLRNTGRLRVRVTVVTHAGGGARPASVSEVPLRRR